MAEINSAITTDIAALDRLTFTVFLAVALHALIILGVNFARHSHGPSTHTMEVTLAQHRSVNESDKADFLAQFNQTGSGTLDEKRLLTTQHHARFFDNTIRETISAQAPQPAKRQRQELVPIVTTAGHTKSPTSAQEKIVGPIPDDDDDQQVESLLQRSLEIASLEARLDKQREIYAKRPRIKRLTSLSTASSADAYYLNSWRRKIENIGNLNYPKEARKKRLYGSLQLMVAILPDGTLKEIEMLQSSGHSVLDDAALRIVKLAAPFAPFPDELRQTTDVIEIIRTWQFRRNSMRSF